MWGEYKLQIHRIQVVIYFLNYFLTLCPETMYYLHLTFEYYIKPKSHKAEH